MSDTNPARLEELERLIDGLISGYNHPYERKIAYGNLRREYSEWGDDSDKLTNIAVIYETPGGSTAQINVTYYHARDTFCLPQSTGDEPDTTDDPEAVVAFIKVHVDQIPQKRVETLQRQVEVWNEQGKSRGEIFAEMNKLLQMEFVGGRITNVELREAINYAIKLRGGSTPGL